MRFTAFFVLAAGFCLALPALGLAQNMDSGTEVQVNPLPPGGEVLLYPGGQYSRMVPSLLYPGEKLGPIRLHRPGRDRGLAQARAPKPRVLARAPAPKPAPRAVARAAPAKRIARAAPAQMPRPAPKAAAPAAGTASLASANPFGGAGDLSHVFANPPPAAPVAPPPVKTAPAAPPVRTASAAPPVRTAPAGPTTGKESLTKRSVILFAKDAPDPAAGALGAIKFLASDLNAAMVSPNARIELEAFGGSKGDKGSDARRLSLKRALAIRQVLIDDGVSADRIDVRAMGGAEDSGPADRVDVYIKV